jgi:hypothetical protein
LGISGYFERQIIFLERKFRLILAQPGHNQRQNQCRQKHYPDKAKKQGQHFSIPPNFSIHAYFDDGRSCSAVVTICNFPATADITATLLAPIHKSRNFGILELKQQSPA